MKHPHPNTIMGNKGDYGQPAPDWQQTHARVAKLCDDVAKIIEQRKVAKEQQAEQQDQELMARRDLMW